MAVEGDTLTVHHGSLGKLADGAEDKWFRCKGANKEGVGASCNAITVQSQKRKRTRDR